MMNISLKVVKKDLILDISESQKFNIFFNHGDEYQFKIGQKGLDFGHFRESKIKNFLQLW